MSEIDEALEYAAKWNQKPPSSKGMNYHMQVLAAEVERRRALDELVEELINFAREAADTQTEVALVTLAAEVQRYRKAVEKVKAGQWITRFDVLEILEET